jgi:hypothetical protein
MIAAADNYPFLNLMWTMIVFFAWVIWIWLLVTILADVFRRRDISGWGKAGWTLLVLVLPFVGVLIYLIAEGGKMAERRHTEAQAARSGYDDYVRSVSKEDQPAEQIARAKQLLDTGAISVEEYDALKRRALAR